MTKYYPLTHPQKRIWYIEKIYPGTSLYNIGGAIRVKGIVDFSILEEAINLFAKKNEGLRLRFNEQSGEVKQYISEYERLKLDFLDFSRFERPEAEFNNWVEEQARKPFVLENERLFYFALFKISDNDCGYLAKFHHIISDGWSTKLMTEQISANYMKLLKGEEISESPEQPYTEYIDSEKKYLLSDRFLKDKVYWNNKFSVLPEAFLIKSSDIIEGKRKTYRLDTELSLRIKEFAAKNKCSLNTFFVALYLLYLNKTTQQEDIVIGTPVLNRSGKKEKGMFGMFTSTMPFRYVIDDNLSVTEIIKKVNEDLMECYFHQKYPYDLLVQDLEIKKKGYDNLFNIYVNFYNTRLNSELNGFPVENVEFYNGKQVYSLQLVIKDWSDSGCLTLDFDYKVNDYSGGQIEDMYIRLTNLIDQVIANPGEKVRNLSLLSDDERRKLLYGFNTTGSAYPKDKMIYELFEEQVEKTPDKVAVSFCNNGLTYGDLNCKANQLARFLIKKGVKKDTIVGLLTTHSIETVIGILGILKAGGAYLPIDPGYPDDRISYMLEDSNCAILLTNMELPAGVCFGGEIINLNDQCLYSGEASNLKAINRPEDLAYVIYTSGSTGKPKGAMIEHQGLVNYIWWARKMYVKNEDEVFPLYSSLAFDLTVTSIFTPLISGSKIIVYSDGNDADEHVLYKIIKENKSTVVKLTPSHLSLLKDMDNRNSSIRRFIVGGEDFKTSLAKDIHESFGGDIEIFNEYGPTETVVGCMIHRYDPENDTRVSVPIGVPADNVQIYILDKNLNPIPPGAVGEMYVSGDGIARGYLNRPELTKEKFINNPFITGKRMYKTGDLARFLNTGRIEYVGRADQQIKIRGYRIEPGEIERCLETHEAVKDAVVIDLEDQNGCRYLCAYVVKKAEVSIGDLKEYLLRYLPDYMVPLHFVVLDKIPLTANGKVSRNLLPIPEIEIVGDTEFVVYGNEKEEILAKSICEVLNIEKVSIKQNFYHLGGDSIKAIQIASKLKEKGFKIRVKDMLSHPIIEEMALYIDDDEGMLINQGPCEGSIKPTPITSWFFSHNHANTNHYTQSVLLKLEQDVKVEWLETILNELIRHHDSLRINYNPVSGRLFYNNVHLERRYIIPEHDLADLPHPVQFDRMTLIAGDLKASFDIENDILIKACVFNLGQNRRRLLITAHHLVVDGVSWRIILDDIGTMLGQLNNKQRIILPPKTHSYQKWAEALEDYGRRVADEEKKYWNYVLSKSFYFPTDYDLGPDTVASSQNISVRIGEDETQCLMTRANSPYNTEPKDLLIAALLRTIKEFTGNEEIIIELEGHGRDDIFGGLDITRTVGWFTNLYPFYIRLKDDDLSCQIKEVKEELRRIPGKGMGFGILKYLIGAIDDNNQRYIRFNYLGEFTAKPGGGFMELLSDQPGNDNSQENNLTCIMDVNCFILDGKLNVMLTYSGNKFSADTMEKFANKYINNLKGIISFCCDKKSIEFTPSDFDAADLTPKELDILFN